MPIICARNAIGIHKSDGFPPDGRSIGQVDWAAIGGEGEAGVDTSSSRDVKRSIYGAFPKTLRVARTAFFLCAYKTNGNVMVGKKRTIQPFDGGICATHWIGSGHWVFLFAGGKDDKYCSASNKKGMFHK